MLQSRIVSSLEHLGMLILEAHPFLVDPPPPWGKLKMCKVGLLTGNITYRAKCISRAVGHGLYSIFIQQTLFF